MHKSWMWKQRSYREQFEDQGGAGGAAVEQAADPQADATEQDQGAGDVDPDAAASGEHQAAGADEEVVIGFGDDPTSDDDAPAELTPAQNAAWARMRKAEQDLKKRTRELESELAVHRAASAPKEDPVGEKPTLESCDYDAEAYAEAVVSWNDRKAKAEQTVAAARQAQEAEQVAWQGKVTAYKAAGAALKVGGFEAAEAVVLGTLNPTQQAILLEGPKTPEASAQLVAALGRNQAKLVELAAIKNPVKYAFAVAELVGKLSVQTKKQPPAPERQVRGSAGGATGVDNARARLEAEADRTGDRSKVIAYDREKRRTQAA